MSTKNIVIGTLSVIGAWASIARTSAYIKKYCTKNKDKVNEADEFLNAFKAPQSIFMGYENDSKYYDPESEEYQKGHQTISESIKKGCSFAKDKVTGFFSKEKK